MWRAVETFRRNIRHLIFRRKFCRFWYTNLVYTHIGKDIGLGDGRHPVHAGGQRGQAQADDRPGLPQQQHLGREHR
jgi:hypothetical protein